MDNSKPRNYFGSIPNGNAFTDPASEDEDDIFDQWTNKRRSQKPKGVEGLIITNNPNRPTSESDEDSDASGADLAEEIENHLLKKTVIRNGTMEQPKPKYKFNSNNNNNDNNAHAPIKDLCIECEDTPAQVRCEQCGDIYCELCFKSLHRKGNRSQHTTEKIVDSVIPVEKIEQPSFDRLKEMQKNNSKSSISPVQAASLLREVTDQSKAEMAEFTNYWRERCKYIPLRLSTKERRLLKLVESALNVSEYTDKIDILTYKSKAQRIHSELEDICSTILGLVMSCDYKMGQTMVNEKTYKDNADFFRTVFEIGRRYKITNPEKMRSEYGKLLYLLQDSVYQEIQNLLGFKLVQPIKTVYEVLTSNDLLEILEDPNIVLAIMEVSEDSSKSRDDIQIEVKQKELAIDYLSKKYAKNSVTSDDIKLLIYSIGDNNSFLAYNRAPVDLMINFLKTYFTPKKVESPFSLEINFGKNGARLSHSHDRQFYYVLQSLSLWRAIMHDMFKLWCVAEEDLLDEQNHYRLRDTGQGLNRVQDAPKIYKSIAKILNSTQQKAGGWVGSSVIHLGDHNVPNAFIFIDKYTQVPRILGPIVKVIQRLEEIATDPGIKDYIEENFDSIDDCKKAILCDFFKHGFDGSGADNFFDAGSCIDGRLTSAWNWTSKIEKKSYYHIFKLSGFSGFDGDFQK